MNRQDRRVFRPAVTPDLEHAILIHEEALEWLETRYPGTFSFTTGDVLRMAGEVGRRWLIARLRAHNIGNEAEFNLPDTADALTILFLRSKGVKFRDAVDAVVGRPEVARSTEPRYGGVWNRLIVAALEGLRRRLLPRLIGSVVFALLHDPKDQLNCLVIVKRRGKRAGYKTSEKPARLTHDYVYRMVLEHPAPSCSVVAPSREVMLLSRDQLPARSEVTSRHFAGVQVMTDLESYELILGTMRPVSVLVDPMTLRFVGKILDIVFVHFEAFQAAQSFARLETPVEPEPASADDLQLWMIGQLLTTVYPGSFCEISETSSSTRVTRVLASSVAKPWEPSPWEAAKSLEMLSGYASLAGIPLVVEKVEHPWTLVIEGIEAELRYVKSKSDNGKPSAAFSALALPINLSSGDSMGSLYMLMPRIERPRLDTDIRLLTVFSRIIGEIAERHSSAVYSADVLSSIVTPSVLKQEEFKTELVGLLNNRATDLLRDENAKRDVRLPFLLLATHGPEPDRFDATISSRLRDWLVETMDHLEWRSFVRSHWSGVRDGSRPQGFIGKVPGIGMLIAFGDLVSKDELDRIRNAFPTTINRTTPTNSPVKLVAWVLDVPAQRIMDAARNQQLPGLADEIQNWAFDVATLVDDLAQSSVLAHEEGQWDAALNRIRRALRKPGARRNSYLRRLAVDCSLSLGDWPGALKYAQEAVALSANEMGSGHVRSLCLEADAHLCLCNPVRSWDLYSQAAYISPSHPLPRYYRGQAALLMARLLRVYEDECRMQSKLDAGQVKEIETVLNTLVDAAMEDLASAADLLEHWGLIPESYQYRNFHLVPTLIGQGLGYLLRRSPGPAASRLQSARRSFPKDDMFFREFIFAKCWEQGVHRQYAALLLGDGCAEVNDRIRAALGGMPSEVSQSKLADKPGKRPREGA